MVARRAGRSSTGCLFSLLLLTAAGYFAYTVGNVYFRYYQFKDAMTQDATFAEHLTDADIVSHLRAEADSLGLPDEAQDVHVQRQSNEITIWAAYEETVEFPGVARRVVFRPLVEKTF